MEVNIKTAYCATVSLRQSSISPPHVLVECEQLLELQAWGYLMVQT
jgi:hypothetical protein